MKKLIFICLFFISLNVPLLSQFQKGDFEMGGTFGFYFINQTSNSVYGYGDNSIDETDVIATLSPVIYIVDGLSIEPEIGFLISDKSEPGIFLLGNVSYTIAIPDKSFAPYFKIGYGITNSLAIPNVNLYVKRSKDMDFNVFNLAGGLKFLINKTAIIRTELNYRKLSYSSDSNSNAKFNTNFVTILFGISFLVN